MFNQQSCRAAGLTHCHDVLGHAIPIEVDVQACMKSIEQKESPELLPKKSSYCWYYSCCLFAIACSPCPLKDWRQEQKPVKQQIAAQPCKQLLAKRWAAIQQAG